MPSPMLFAWLLALLIPAIVLIAEIRCAGRVNLLRFSLIAVAGILIVVVGTAMVYDHFLHLQLAAFDLDGDGIFSGIEQTPDQQQALSDVTNDLSRSLAPFTAGAFAVLYVGSICGIIALLSHLTRKRARDV